MDFDENNNELYFNNEKVTSDEKKKIYDNEQLKMHLANRPNLDSSVKNIEKLLKMNNDDLIIRYKINNSNVSYLNNLTNSNFKKISKSQSDLEKSIKINNVLTSNKKDSWIFYSYKM